jgi:hypothetical protein
LLILAFRFTLFSQDYKVTSVELLQNDMTARKTILTEKINGGQQCAVLRISTQNILDPQRDIFQFECDMGSVIRERRKDGGEICLWVSPGIKILKIKHSALGNIILNIPEMLKDNVQGLNTYRITIVGTQKLSKETLAYGKCQMVFLPTPNDAVLFINGDSIGAGNHTITSLSGNYHWLLKHPLYYTEEGDVELTKGKIDSVYVGLKPAYGYISISPGRDTTEIEVLDVYIDGMPKGTVPFKSDKLAPGIHEVILKVGNNVKAISQIRVKEQLVSVNQVDDLIWTYEKVLNINKRLTEFNQANNPLGSDENVELYNNTTDTLYKSKQTRYEHITGKVTINSKPRAWVTVDSVKYGLTPVTIDNLAVGTHHLELAAGNYSTVTREISVVEDNEMSYYLHLKRLCVATIVSDRPDDQVFVDGEFAGRTPLTIEKPFGVYNIRIKRISRLNLEEVVSYIVDEEITLSADDLEPTIFIPLGQTVHIEAGNKKANLYRDNSYIGRTPVDLFITNGQHTIRVEHGWREGEKEITISKDNLISDLNIETYPVSMASYLKRGAFFFTGNLGFLNKGGKSVYGFNIGDIAKGGQAGWYFNIMTNTNFISQLYHKDYSMLNAYLVSYGDNAANNALQESYQGESTLIRASALFGVALRVVGPVYLKFGCGYGIRREAWKNSYGSWVINDPVSWQTFESSLGLQCCIYNIVFNTDVLIPAWELLSGNKKLVEFRVGMGFCLKHKR